VAEENLVILCDTNVIIEILKGDEKTIKTIERIGLENIAISSVTVMELYFGALNKRELNKIKKHLKALNIVHFDNKVRFRQTRGPIFLSTGKRCHAMGGPYG
jgi:predicted nucleic acid-binding protein